MEKNVDATLPDPSIETKGPKEETRTVNLLCLVFSPVTDNLFLPTEINVPKGK